MPIVPVLTFLTWGTKMIPPPLHTQKKYGPPLRELPALIPGGKEIMCFICVRGGMGIFGIADHLEDAVCMALVQPEASG
eukprot:4742143-Heterocapsa_arctica.AAC.1